LPIAYISYFIKNIKLPDPKAAEAGAGEVFHAAVKRIATL
jgi:hypothetical protein